MKRQLILIALMGCFTASAFAGSSWETDFKRAAKKADRKDRYMLLDFTGSDWCGWCIKLNKEVFDKSDFKDYARKNLILVEVDFPRMKKQKANYQVRSVVGHQCQYGPTTPGVGGRAPARKAPRFLNTSEEILKRLDRKCNGKHVHQHLETKARTAAAAGETWARYP